MGMPSLGHHVTLLLAGIGTLSSNALAQSASRALLRGQVVADSTFAPIQDAEVLLVEPGRSTRSAVTGRFVLTNVPAGSITVRVRHPKYGAAEQSLTVAADDTLEFRVVLTPLTPVLAPVAVNAPGDVTNPLLFDFRRRRETTNGKFLTAAEITQFGSHSLVSVVRGHVGGFDLVRHPSGNGTAFASRHQGATSLAGKRQAPNECYSNIWLNGQLSYSWSPARPEPPRV